MHGEGQEPSAHGAPPLIFISHSSRDKERFVRAFEAGLRANGVRTVFDERDFLLGDSLPEVMFERGIALADAIVIVLSEASLRSPYVTAERDAAVMRRIEEDVPNLVFVLDNLSYTDIPMSLRTVLRTPVSGDAASIEKAIAETVRAAYGAPRPSQDVGTPPKWVVASFPSLTKDPLDAAILAIAVRAAVEELDGDFVGREEFFQEAKRLGRTLEDAHDSINELDRMGWLEGYHSFGEGAVARQYRATRAGIARWLSATDQNYEERLRLVGATLINEGCRNNLDICRVTGYNRALVNHLLDELEWRGLVEVRRVAAGGLQPVTATAALRRFLRLQD